MESWWVFLFIFPKLVQQNLHVAAYLGSITQRQSFSLKGFIPVGPWMGPTLVSPSSCLHLHHGIEWRWVFVQQSPGGQESCVCVCVLGGGGILEEPGL